MPTRRRVARKRARPTAPLTEYRRKRDFGKTREPSGHAASRDRRKGLRFVIQKHAASHLHFDLRLELDGVMKSWALPKGPSYDPAARRLAMEVEDHPTEYNRFEGTIPEGEYGGGTVMIWDRGTYEPVGDGGEDTLRAAYRRGSLKIVFHGHRMLGEWALVRMRADARSRKQWLLIKHRDDYAKADFDVVALADTSVASGRTMAEIASRSRRVWRSNRRATSSAD